MLKAFLLIFCLLSIFPAQSKGVYQTTEGFINKAYQGEIPKAKVVWLTSEDKVVIADLLQRPFNKMRIRYWPKDNETIWILNEVGKEKPITIGVHIKDHKIVTLKVLTFRETRGEEVRHDFYADQFNQTGLKVNNQLDRHIDGITGATLSVWATTKVARFALWLDKKVQLDNS